MPCDSALSQDNFEVSICNLLETQKHVSSSASESSTSVVRDSSVRHAATLCRRGRGEGGVRGGAMVCHLVELIGLQNLLLEDAVCKVGLAIGWLRELGHDQLGIPTGLLQGQGWPLACHAVLNMAPIELAACKLLPQPKLHQHLQHQRQPNLHSACLTLLSKYSKEGDCTTYLSGSKKKKRNIKPTPFALTEREAW